MKGRHFFLIVGIIFITVSNFSQSLLIKSITTAITFICIGVYIGITLKSWEVKYKNEKKEDDFNLALEVE